MTENNEGGIAKRSKKYFTYLVIILFIVQLLDSYITQVPNVIPSAIIEEFLPFMDSKEADATYELAVGIATCGTFLVFVIQFFADKYGRKLMLVITVLGMSLSSLLLITSMNIFQYSIYLLVVYLFFSSDLWLIYVNEESTKKTRAFWTNVILAGGVGGPLLLPIFRDMFTQGETLYWRGVPLFGIFLGIPLGILVILTIKETLKFQEIKDIGQAKLNPFTLAKENIREIRKSKHWKEMIMILIMSFCGGLNYNFLSTGQRFLKEYSPYTEDDINSLITIIGISVVLGYLLTGIIADKIGRKPMIIIYSAMLPVSIILVVIGAGLPTGAFYVIPVGYCLSYVSYWGLLSVIRIVTFETLETDKRGTGSGMRGFYYAAGITGGLLIGAGITLISSLGIAYIILSLFVIIDIPLTLKFIKETKGTNLSNIDEEK